MQELNVETLREMRASHGSGAEFDAFDHSHMGEGEEESFIGYPEDENVKYIHEESIKIGGDGMNGFHDQILPQFADKYGKSGALRPQM